MPLLDAGQGTPAVTLTDLLAIEDTPELLALCCPQTGIPVWPNVRIAFFRQIMADLLFATGSVEPPAESRSWRAVGVLGRAAAHNVGAVFGKRLRSDVIINTEAIGDELRDGRWFNRYVDPFGDLPSGRQAVVMANMFEWQWRKPRHNERIYYHAPIQVGAVLAAKLVPRKTAMRLAQAVTALACDRAKVTLGWEIGRARRAAFVQWSASKIAGLPFRYRAYRRLMQRVQPRLLLGSSGCYGAHAPLIAAARDLGVVTAEYQHGAISSGHDAYNFAPAIFASEAYRRTLPQYLLTYGTWWSAQVTAPVECVAIGNPARAAKLDQMAPLHVDRRTVLILGDGIEFDLYLDLARAIARAVAGTGLEVALRPHPLERTSVLQRHGGCIDGVRIDVVPDIYTSFAQAHTVVSEVSTGLFEAVGLVARTILLNTAKSRFAYPEHPFTAANTVQEVIGLIHNVPKTPRVDADALWSPDWKNNYKRFLSEKAGIDVE
jgi:hypothetical protein